MDPRRLSIKQHRVYTLAKRTRRIVVLNQHDPLIASVGGKVGPLADAFIAKYTEVKAQRAAARDALKLGRSEIEALNDRLRLWRSALERELPGFERNQVSTSVNDPDGVLKAAKVLVALVLKQGGDVDFATMVTDDVTAVSERAEQKWSEGQAQLQQLQVLQGELRSIGGAFLSGLVTLRAVVRETLGRSNRHYLALRTHPKGEDADVEEDDDDTEPIAPEAASAPKA